MKIIFFSFKDCVHDRVLFKNLSLGKKTVKVVLHVILNTVLYIITGHTFNTCRLILGHRPLKSEAGGNVSAGVIFVAFTVE